MDQQLDEIFALEVEFLLQLLPSIVSASMCYCRRRKNLSVVRKGLVGQIRSQQEDLHIPNVLFIHSIIHQQAHCRIGHWTFIVY